MLDCIQDVSLTDHVDIWLWDIGTYGSFTVEETKGWILRIRFCLHWVSKPDGILLYLER